MMSSFRQNKGRRRLWAATVLVLLLFGADIISGGALRARIRAFSAGISVHGGALISRIAGSGFFSSRASLAAQNRSLAEQLQQYEERASAYSALEEENAQLRALVGLAAHTHGLTAPVVSSLYASPYGTFLIGAGSAEGVAHGNIVLSSEGFVLGEVADVALHTSVVHETFAPDASVDAIVNGTAVTLEGEGGGNARATIPRGVSIAVGASASAPQYAGRPVGIVGGVATSSGGAAQDLFVRIPVNRSGLQFVYVAPSR